MTAPTIDFGLGKSQIHFQVILIQGNLITLDLNFPQYSGLD